MFFKNLRIFRLDPAFRFCEAELDAALAKQAFQLCSKQDMQSVGWAKPCDHASTSLVHAIDGQYLLSLRVESKILPMTVINQFTAARAREIEERQGFRPGRKQMKEIKEQVTDELLPKAFSQYRDTRIWIDTRNRWLVIGGSTASKCDEVMGALAKVLDPFPVKPLHVEQSPAAAMTNWLTSDDPPANFSIDQETELRSTNETRAAVRYLRQSVELDDAQRHVEAGKQCTRLAMTWADRISFVLTDSLEIKRVAPLDVLRANANAGAQNAGAQNAGAQFDSDFALMAGEVSQMISGLVDALGGEKPHL